MTTDQERLDRIADLRDRIAALRAEFFKEIHGAFHDRTEEPARGWLAKVAKASGFTREYVAQIRDGKAKAGE